MKRLLVLFNIFLIIFSFINAKTTISKKDEDIYYTSVSRSEYPNASTAILLDETIIKLNKDNTYTKKRRVVKKLLSYKGKKEHSDYKIYYDKRDTEIELIKANTISLNRNNKFDVMKADKEAVRVLDSPKDSGKMDYAVHNMMIVPFSKTDVNKIVNIEYKVKSNDKNKFTDRIIFADSEPVYRKRYKIILPKDMNINYSFDKKNIKFNKKIKDNKKILYWRKDKLEQIVNEPNMPRWSSFLPTVNITTYNSWDRFKNKLEKKFKNNVKITEKIRKKSKKLIKDKNTIKSKVYSIKQYIAKNIDFKYVGNLREFEFKSPEKVLEDGYGASFDRIVLFLSMLKAVDIKASPVAASLDKYYWKNYKNYYNPDDFDGVIARVKIDGKNYYFSTYSEFEKLTDCPYYNQIGFDLYKKDNYVIEINDSKKSQGKVEVDYNVKIDKKGNAIVDKKLKYFKQKAVKKRRKFKYMSDKKRKQNFEKLIGNISQNAKALSEKRNIKLNDIVTISYRYKHTSYAAKDGKFLYFDLPIQLTHISFSKDKKSRKYSYLNLSQNEYVVNYTIEYPENLKPILYPKSVSKNKDIFSLNEDIEIEDNILKINYKYNSKPGDLNLEEYKRVYDLNLKLNHPKHKKVLLKEEAKFLGIF